MFFFQPELLKQLSDVLKHGGNSPVARMQAGTFFSLPHLCNRAMSWLWFIFISLSQHVKSSWLLSCFILSYFSYVGGCIVWSLSNFRASGIQLKNSLYSKDQNIALQYKQRWLQFPDDVKNHIKSNVSVCMIAPILLMHMHLDHSPVHEQSDSRLWI